MSASAPRASAPRAATLRACDLRYLGALTPSGFMLLIVLLVPGWAALAALVTWVVSVVLEAFWAPARRSPRARIAHPALSWILRLYVPLQLAVLAAAYGFGVARNHPFIDGNKRTSLMVIYTFLGINDVEFFVPEAEFATIILDLAAGDVSEESLARWIRDNWPK